MSENASTCVVCTGDEPRQTEVGYSCDKCLRWLDKLLKDIEDYYAGLSVEKGSGSNYGSRGAPGFSSTSPAREDVIVAQDMRSHGGASVHLLRDPTVASDEPIRSILGGLHGIAQWIRDERQQKPETNPTVASEVRYLRVSLDWYARQTRIIDHQVVVLLDELADDLKELHRQVRALAGLKPVKVDVCEFRNKDGLCGGNIYSFEDYLKCMKCKREMPRDQWFRSEKMTGA